MLTKNEITALSLSPTKKDFYQIWNELLEVAGKLSERWDPTSTNESDPGIVILKALTGIADKLNYNIDKNILEAFMPTAAQEESMRKLCEMLGYNIKYYRSATTDVTIKYYNTDPSTEEAQAISNKLAIPKFTVITNSDQDISYFTINEEDILISPTDPTCTVNCMEGQVVKCESIGDNNVITINQISEDNRFYLPETQVAENGMFIYNIFTVDGINLSDGEPWKKVDNLNTQARGSKVFKFGFDSYESRPYIEFPEDYSELFGEGLFIYYTRTSGVNGNISARTLTQLEFPSTTGWADVAAASFSVENVFAATTGSNIETIKQAYSNFKKTIGTFNTLVTCRDYMNKVYLMTDDVNKPLVSNILVTDIRNDLNRAITICSCDNSGIFYKEMPIIDKVEKQNTKVIPINTTVNQEVVVTANKPVFNAVSKSWHLGSVDGMELAKTKFIGTSTDFNPELDADDPIEKNVKVVGNYWTIVQNGKEYITTLLAKDSFSIPISTSVTETVTTVEEVPAIDHFDIIFYPFKSYSQIKNNVKDIREVYDASFKYNYNDGDFDLIRSRIEAEDIKTIAHNIEKARIDDIVSITNYLRLNATIATNSKITLDEGTLLIDKIKVALANAFNMRELDFGEEIPFDSIVEVIEKADSRIRVASVNEPTLYTTFTRLKSIDANGIPTLKEYAVESKWLTAEAAAATGRFDGLTTFNTAEAKEIYNKLAVRNILAGRVPLFNYDTTFKTSFSEGTYCITDTSSNNYHIETEALATELAKPDSLNPFTILSVDDVIYTGQYDSAAEKTIYTKTYTPEEYKNTIITDFKNTKITDITANCEIFADTDGNITDITLSDNEFVKFRAPNFITTKTYPAYVNYHLELANDTERAAEYAEADSLFNVLNSDRSSWSPSNESIGWQKVLTYFDKAKLEDSDIPYKKTFKLVQKVSKYTEVPSEEELNKKDGLVIKVENDNVVEDLTAEELLALSGCVKLTNERTAEGRFIPKLAWDDSNGDNIPDKELVLKKPIELELSDPCPFIIDSSTFSNIKSTLDAELLKIRDQLPSECAWTISFEFECVPFESSSLDMWKQFIKDEGAALLGSSPVSTEVIDSTDYNPFWRILGEGHKKGKYVINSPNNEKLLKFDHSYFGLLPESRLKGIYIATSLGNDESPTTILNNSEYQLKPSEYLYIEYTPSTVTEDGTTQDQPAVTEILGPGTIIRPSGFETGLVDSYVYEKSGHTAHKTVTFKHNGSSKEVGMQRFSANEQVEVRDFAKVELTKDSFTANGRDTNKLYVYKNFNNCKELENRTIADNGDRINNSYTLKDGEYIFYTDTNKTEFAVFGSGTEVILEEDVVLPVCEQKDISVIFDEGAQAVPWVYLSLKGKDKIIFQEFQYITLGAEDTLKKITLLNGAIQNLNGDHVLNSTWQKCDNVEYLVAGSDKIMTLPVIDVQESLSQSDNACWKASCTLDLNVTSSDAQTLRTTDKLKTSVKLNQTSTIGEGNINDPKLIIDAEDEDHPISFKTNLSCQACGSDINIKDVYSNPNGLTGFELKVFAKDEPAIVRTEPAKVVPYKNDNITDITKWPSYTNEGILKERSDFWSSVDLGKLKVSNIDSKYSAVFDYALRLPVSILPDTYGIFCVYVNYTSTEAVNGGKTWIELLPGTSGNITLLNLSEEELENAWEKASSKNESDKLVLKQGINCVRINKSGRIFIKASSEAQGSLLFDELRLVVSKPVTYIDSNAEPKTKYTQGLNLDKLGYLLIEEDSDAIQQEKLTQLYIDYTKDAEAKLANIASELDNDFLLKYNNITSIEDKLKTLVDAENAIRKDIEILGTTLDFEHLKQLTRKYAEMSEALKIKEAVLEALKNNKNSDDIELQIIALLNNVNTLESEQQQLLQELDKLKANAIASIDSLTDADILEDFTYNAKLNKITQKAFGDIKTSAIEKVEEDYMAEVNKLAANLSLVVNSEDYVTIVALLDSLQADANAENIIKLNSLVRRLRSLLDSDIVSIINEIRTTTVDSESYDALLTLLLKLKAALETLDLQFMVSELEQIMSTGSYAQLESILTELTAQENKDLAAIKEVINELETELLKATPNKDIVLKLVGMLCNDAAGDNAIGIKEYLDAKNNNIITKIAAIEKVLEDRNELIETLTSLRDDQVDCLLQHFITIKPAYINEIEKLKAVYFQNITNTDSWSISDYFKTAVKEIWPVYTKASIKSFIENLCGELFTIISDLNTANTSTTIIGYTGGSSWVITYDILNAWKTVINMSAFETLLTEINALYDLHDKKTADESLINEISALLPDSIELKEALNAVDKDDNRNIIIKQLIENITKPERRLSEKQQDLSLLKDAVIQAKELDLSLLNIMADLLFPTIAKIEVSKEYTDAFYKALINQVKATKSSIINVYKAEDTINIAEFLGSLKSTYETSDKANALDQQFISLVESSDMEMFKDKLANVTINMDAYGNYTDTLTPDICDSVSKLIDISKKVNYVKAISFSQFINDIFDSSDISNIKKAVKGLIEYLNELVNTGESTGTLTTAISSVLTDFRTIVDETKALNVIETADYTKVYDMLKLEEQLLTDIRKLDVNRDFYYTVPVETSLAIDFNESNSDLNTLMNPITNYDINNVNNSFVISKLDIDYLDKGIQIARSSRLNF